MADHEVSEAREPETQSHFTERRKSSSAMLLHHAIRERGVDVVAGALGLTTAQVERLAASHKAMNLEQQRTLALAVLVISEGHPLLRRKATTLLAQVRAAADFAGGATERHNGPPPTNRWPI